MKSRLLQWFHAAVESLWVLPVLLTVGAVVLAWSLTGLKGPGVDDVAGFDPGAVGGVLTSLAAASITVVGLVFSLTMLVLSSASQQFGPRLLATFMRKTGSKLAIGGFVGSFVYQILVAAALTRGHRVPDLAVWIGLLGGLAVFALLLWFLQMVSHFIRAPMVIDEVARDLEDALERAPERFEGALAGARTGGRFRELRSPRSGYLQRIGSGDLFQAACEHDLEIRVHKRPGTFVCRGEALLSVSGDDDDDRDDDLLGHLVLGRTRTHHQDLEFAAKQLVEIALKAMSPGINDPYTAINVIERIAGSLAGRCRRAIVADLRRDDDGRLRLSVPLPGTGELFDAIYHPLREYVRGSAMVSIAMLDSFAQLADSGLHPDAAAAVRNHATLLAREFLDGCPSEHDRAEFERRFESLREWAEQDDSGNRPLEAAGKEA